ncbi:MAG: DUF2062 domain-containing protein [Planctomycetota bacterium]
MSELVAVFGRSEGRLREVTGLLEAGGFEAWPLCGAGPPGERLLEAGRQAEKRGQSLLPTLDADLGDDPRELEILRAEAKQGAAALVVARRDGQDGSFRRDLLLRLAGGIDPAAARSSFRVYPVAALSRIACFGRGREFELEFLARSSWAGLPLKLVDLPSGSRALDRPLPAREPGARRVYARLCLRNLNPWPFQKQFHSYPGEVPFSFRNILAWHRSFHARVTRRLDEGERGLSWRHPIRSVRNLHLERTAPKEIALACMLGVFLGALPLLFVHTIAIVFYATRLGLNRAIAFYASNLCAPFMPPFVPAIDIEVGHYLLHGRFLTLEDLGSKQALFQTLCAEAHLRMLEYLVGSLVVGPLLALLVGGVAYGLFSLRHGARREASQHG